MYGTVLIEPSYDILPMDYEENRMYRGDRAVLAGNYTGDIADMIFNEEEKEQHALHGVYNLDQKKWIVEPGQYNTRLFEEMIVFFKDDKNAVFVEGRKPEFVISNIYESNVYYGDSYVKMYSLDERYIYFRNTLLGPYDQFDMESSGKGYFSFTINGKWGLISLGSAREIVPCEWDSPFVVEAAPFYATNSSPLITGKKDGYEFRLDTMGRFVYNAFEGKAVSENQKYGYALIRSGDSAIVSVTVPCEYDRISGYLQDMFETDLLQVWKNGKTGLINTRNEVLIPVDQVGLKNIIDPYERTAVWFSNGTTSSVFFMDSLITIGNDILSYQYLETGNAIVILVKHKDKTYSVWSLGGEQMTKDSYDDIYMTHREDNWGNFYLITNKEKKYGLLKPDGRLITEPVYDKLWAMDLDEYYDYMFFFTMKNNKLGVLSPNGNTLVENRYDNIAWCDIDMADNVCFAVCSDKKWGVTDTSGREILKTEYDQLDVVYAWYPVRKNNLYGYLNDSLKPYIECKYEEADELGYGYAIVKYKGKYGVINRLDQFVVKPEFEKIAYADMTHWLVKKGGLWGVSDTLGKMVIAPSYNDIGNNCTVNKHLNPVQKGKKWSVINLNTKKEICPYEYDRIEMLNSGEHILAVKNGLSGYLSIEGATVIPCQYQFLSEYVSEGYLCAGKNKKFGYIDLSDKEVIGFRYDDVTNFHDGIARVRSGKKWGLIDKTGKELCPFEYDEITDYTPTQAIAVKNKKFGVILHNGEIVIPFEYEKIYIVGTQYRCQKNKNEAEYKDM